MKNYHSNLQKHKATSLTNAIELTEMAAMQKRMPSKVLAELVSADYNTFRRWMANESLPLNKLIPLERQIGTQFISDYLCVSQGKKVVIDIPRGKQSTGLDLADLQVQHAQMFALLTKFYKGEASANETLSEIKKSLCQLAFQHENVKKHDTPELWLGSEYE